MSGAENPAAVGENWALVKVTLTAIDYVPVKVIRSGKRFTFVEPRPGIEWRYTTRGLWDGFPSRAAASAEIDRMMEAGREFLAARQVRP